MTEKAFTGFANRADADDEFGRMQFVTEQLLNGLATTTLVQVKAVDTGAQTVDVQPLIAQIDGAGNAVAHGTINGLPWFALRAGSSAVKLVPRVGDIGAAVFCHNDISAVKKTKAPANPGSRRRFDWADGLYLGGFLGPTPTQFITLDDDTGIEIHAASGKTIKLVGDVEIQGDISHTGDMTSSGTVTATTDVVGGGKHLKTHTHGGVQTGGGTSGPPS